MIKRGKILRDTNAGPGLLAVDGQHYQFSLHRVWKSDTHPTPGMTVEVTFAGNGNMAAITPIFDSRMAKEQADAVGGASGQRTKGLVGAAVAKVGVPTIIATALLILGWLFLTAISIQSPLGRIDLTLWQVLGFLNSGNAFESAIEGRSSGGAGFYGFIALVALAAPYLPHLWKDKRACLAGVLPLVFICLTDIMFCSSLGGAVTGPFAEVARQARQEAMKAVSFGFGTYFSGAVSLYFVGASAKKFLLSHAQSTEMPERSREAAV